MYKDLRVWLAVDLTVVLSFLLNKENHLIHLQIQGGGKLWYATFNNISAILWQSVLLVEETGEPGEKNTDLSQVTDKLYHIMLYQVLQSQNSVKFHIYM
jgi:hypothetical protein